MAELNDWDVIAANNNDTPPDGWPENSMNYSEVNDTGREGMAVLARYFQDINGSLTTGGVADAYTLTLNAGHTAYTGLYFAATIHATNTGASTINVNGIGIQSIVDRAGNALVGNEMSAGGIYEFRYDGTNMQLMGSHGGALSASTAVLINTNDPDLVDTDVPLLVGAADPNTEQHIEMGPTVIQSKSDNTTAATISINSLGGDVNIGAQSGTGEVILYRDGFIRADTGVGGGFNVRSDGNSDTEQRLLGLLHQNGARRGFLGYVSGSASLLVRNEIHGADVAFQGEDLGGTVRNVFVGDPDGASKLHYAGGEVVETLPDFSGGLRANNTLTGGGYERVLTVSDNGVIKRKTSDTGRTTSTLSDDPHLKSFSLEANTWYSIYLHLHITSGSATSEYKMAFQLSQSEQAGSYVGHFMGDTQVGIVLHSSDLTTPATRNLFGPDTDYTAILDGLIHTHASLASTIDFQWAQEVSDPNALTLHEGSYMVLRKLIDTV